MGILTAAPLPWIEYPTLGCPACWKYSGLIMLGVQYVVFVIAFIIDHKAVKLMGINENVHPLRNIAHLLSAPVVLLVYNVIAFYAVLKFVFRGKKDAGHVMAAKAGFGAVTVIQEPLSQAHQPLSREEFAVIDLSTRLGPLERGASGSFLTTAVQKSSTATHSWPGVVSRPLSWVAPAKLRSHSFPVVEQSKSRLESIPASDLERGQFFGGEILCVLPAVFFFGKQAFDPRSVPAVHSPARIYGLHVAAP